MNNFRNFDLNLLLVLDGVPAAIKRALSIRCPAAHNRSAAGLVADHEDAITGVIEGHYALDRGRRENEVFDAMGVAAIDVDHSVTIEKCAGF